MFSGSGLPGRSSACRFSQSPTMRWRALGDVGHRAPDLGGVGQLEARRASGLVGSAIRYPFRGSGRALNLCSARCGGRLERSEPMSDGRMQVDLLGVPLGCIQVRPGAAACACAAAGLLPPACGWPPCSLAGCCAAPDSVNPVDWWHALEGGRIAEAAAAAAQRRRALSEPGHRAGRPGADRRRHPRRGSPADWWPTGPTPSTPAPIGRRPVVARAPRCAHRSAAAPRRRRRPRFRRSPPTPRAPRCRRPAAPRTRAAAAGAAAARSTAAPPTAPAAETLPPLRCSASRPAPPPPMPDLAGHPAVPRRRIAGIDVPAATAAARPPPPAPAASPAGGPGAGRRAPPCWCPSPPGPPPIRGGGAERAAQPGAASRRRRRWATGYGEAAARRPGRAGGRPAAGAVARAGDRRGAGGVRACRRDMVRVDAEAEGRGGAARLAD